MRDSLYLITNFVFMNSINNLGIVPFESSVLFNVLEDYKSPKDKAAKMGKAGNLIRLKKGMFVVSPEISKQVLSKELIANHLYGPSYVTAESALSYYGIIPERVFSVRSACTKRSKKVETVLGLFEYFSFPFAYFPIGINLEIIQDAYAFLIASPEKALCDLVQLTAGLRIQSGKAMFEFLTGNLRIDLEEHSNWDMSIFDACITAGSKKRELTFLHQVLQNG